MFTEVGSGLVWIPREPKRHGPKLADAGMVRTATFEARVHVSLTRETAGSSVQTVTARGKGGPR